MSKWTSAEVRNSGSDCPFDVFFKPNQVKCLQRPGTEAIRTKSQPSKPKREITNITNSQNTKRNIWSIDNKRKHKHILSFGEFQLVIILKRLM